MNSKHSYTVGKKVHNPLIPVIDAYSGEIGRLFGLKTAGCSGKSATLLVAPD